VRLRPCLGVALATISSVAGAQVQPFAGRDDPHLQSVNYSAGQIVQLRSAPGYQLMVELSADEAVKSVAIGDSGAWQVNVSKEGDQLFVKPTAAGSTTNMTVVTSVRVYYFELQSLSGPSPDMPYTVQFHYPTARVLPADVQYVDVSAATRRLSRYRVSGDRQLRPNAVSNDEQHTYLSWPKNVAIPAIYAVDRSGGEMLVNGMMRSDDVYVVDGTPQLLIFRIDHGMARAERIFARKGR
jgi:type IV secretion system protein VirB9